MTPEKIRSEDEKQFDKVLNEIRNTFQTEALEAEFKIIQILQELKNKTSIEYINLSVFNRKVSVQTSKQELKKAAARIIKPEFNLSSTKESYESEWF